MYPLRNHLQQHDGLLTQSQVQRYSLQILCCFFLQSYSNVKKIQFFFAMSEAKDFYKFFS